MTGVVLSQLCTLAASLAAGLFPEAIAPDIDGIAPRTLPVLQCLALGQAAYLLLIWPLATRGGSLPSLLGMLGMSLLLSLPAWALAAVLSDAVAIDVARTALYLLLLCPLSLVAARGLSRPSGRTVLLLGLLIIVLGLPAGYYIVREFIAVSPLGAVERIWQLGPLTTAWEVATPRSGHWLPQPVWAALVWVVVAVGVQAVDMGIRRKAFPPATD